ncbi:MAG: hypothetical protein KA290_06340 [Chitinophagaceae bacterium]|nr:hypothetical protein [Chitinophagaceae bacterium]
MKNSKSKRLISLVILLLIFSPFAKKTYAQNATVVEVKTLKEKVIKSVSSALSGEDLKTAIRYIDISFDASQKKQAAKVKSGIRKFENHQNTVFAKRKQNGLNGSPWQDCGDACRKLHSGDIFDYATCYWLCVANGGPTSSTSILQ